MQLKSPPESKHPACQSLRGTGRAEAYQGNYCAWLKVVFAVLVLLWRLEGLFIKWRELAI